MHMITYILVVEWLQVQLEEHDIYPKNSLLLIFVKNTAPGKVEDGGRGFYTSVMRVVMWAGLLLVVGVLYCIYLENEEKGLQNFVYVL